MKLKTKIRILLCLNTLILVVFRILMLIFPLALALSSVWIDWIAGLMILNISAFFSSNKDALVSLFGVIAGAYLTLYATYILKKKDDIRKSIATKQIAFYEPILKEFRKAFEIRKHENIWLFDSSGYNYRGFVPWNAWKEFNSTFVKYIIPGVFERNLKTLDQKIKSYMSLYHSTLEYCKNNASDLLKERDLVDLYFLDGDSNCLTEIFTDTYSGKSIKNAISNVKDINVDCDELASAVKNIIVSSKEYAEFVSKESEIGMVMEESYKGLDFLLAVIYRKYKNKNLLA